MKVQRIVSLIKQTYNQPLLFHRLHSHLTHVLGTVNPLLEMSDDWSKMLIYSAVQSKHPNQALEAKMLVLLKSMRPPVEGRGCRLRLWVVLYYMRNRPSDMVNHLIVFELVSHFLGVSAFTDGFILSIFASSTVGPVFGLSRNKKLRDDGTAHLLAVVGRRPLSMLNRALALPCHIGHAVQPPALCGLDIQSDALTLRALECICFYAKYAKNVEFVKATVPEGPVFVDALRRFISKIFETEWTQTECSAASCVMENLEVLESIRRAYEEASDKKVFVSRIMDFVGELQ